MSTMNEIVNAAMDLGRSERAAIAMMMLDSLPADEAEDPEDILAEALRRDAEIEMGLVKPLTHEELMARLAHLRGNPA